MVGKQENDVTVITGIDRSACTIVSTPLDQRQYKTALSPPEQQGQHLPGPSTPIISTKDEVIIETSDGGLFLLSRCRLAAESLFFRALFHGAYIESKSSRVRLTCVCSSDFRACLSLTAHIYSGTTPKFSAEAAMNLMVTASFLQMSSLMEELVSTVVSYVHPSNRLAAYRKATIRSAVLANKLWNSIIKEFRLHLNNCDYEKMTESEILAALIDERLDIESREEEPLINNWIAKNPKNHDRMLRLKSEVLRRRGTDGRLNAVIRDRVPREIIMAVGSLVTLETSQNYSNSSIDSWLFIAGGWSTGGPSDIIEVFNPRSHSWVVPDFAIREIPRAYHGAVLCGEKVIILGGFNGREYFQHAKIFDLNKKTWDAITNMHDRRCYVAATPFTDPSGIYHVVAIGEFKDTIFNLNDKNIPEKKKSTCHGLMIGYNGHRRLNSAEILHIEKDHWYHLPFMSKQRSDAGAVVLAGRPTIIGGFDGRTIHNDIEMLDFDSQSWFIRTLINGSSSMRSVRTGVSAVTYEANSVIVVGGFNGVRRLKSTEFYDHRVGLWYPLPEMEITRSNFGIEIMNGSIYIAGGFDGTRTTSTVERFDMRAYKWEALPSMSIPKSALRLVRIADHDIIRSLINFQPHPLEFKLDLP
ncbi:kelch repeat protein [Dictyocaulus viviparus]|uniref:Kelch repeat protein n=1 Tax=Dictyocaulus viviparus TaxID=29172 RepID=A0A0D8XG80_DICVI|nr:kelch repeat protein [Dictyocaulus viviparus]